MTTIKEMVDLKKRIDDACEDVANEVTAADDNNPFGDRVRICFHSHYSTVAFSVYRGDRETHKKVIGGIWFMIEEGLAPEEYEPITSKIIELVNSREI